MAQTQTIVQKCIEQSVQGHGQRQGGEGQQVPKHW